MPRKKHHPAVAASGAIAKGLWWVSKKTGKGVVAVAKKSGKAAKKRRVKTRKTKPTEKGYEQLKIVNSVAGEFDDFLNVLHNRSTIALVFGKRGSGKSTLGFRLLENLRSKTGRPCFVLGVKQDLLPNWIQEISDIEAVENGGVVLVDEGAVTFNSRESMREQNVELGKLLAIARHKDLSVIFLTQNTGSIDKNVLNLADIIFAKEGSLLQQQMERAALRNFVTKADGAIKEYPKHERVSYSYVFSDDFEGLLHVPLPSFWDENVSKSHS